MDNFWKLIERHRVSFLITVPTAVSALMQRKVDADVSTLRLAISGSAPMPVELFHRFEEATGVRGARGLRADRGDLPRRDQPALRRAQDRLASASPSPTPTCAILKCDADGRVLAELRHRRDRRDLREEPRGQRRGLRRRRPQPRDDRRGRLPADRRPRPARRRRLPLDHRAGQGPDHPRRPQHRPGADRGGADGAPGGRLRRRDRPARRAFGRAAGGLRRALRRRDGDRRGAARRTPARTSPSARRCRSTSRSCRSCRRPRSARCSSPTCGGGRSPGSSTRRWPRPGSAARVAAVVEDRRLGLVAELAAGPDGRDDAARRRRSAASPCRGAGGTR